MGNVELESSSDETMGNVSLPSSCRTNCPLLLLSYDGIYNLSVQCISMIRILRIIYLESTFNNLQFSVLFQNVVIVLQGFGMNCECHILLSVAT